MEWIFYIMVVFYLFDIEEKLRKIIVNKVVTQYFRIKDLVSIDEVN